MKLKKSIKDIALYSEGKGKAEKGIKLSSNEMPFPVDPSSKKVLYKSIGKINRYPDKNPLELKERIGKIYGLRPENIVLGNGSDELMQFVFMAFVERAQNVIIPEKTFLMYAIYADIFGVKKVISRMKDCAIDLDDILKKIDKKTAAVFIANPNNPTGIFIPEKDLLRFLAKVPKSVTVIIDAAYMDFSEKNYERSFKNILKKGKNNIIFLRTFSKSFGMAGLRLGYSVSDKETSRSLESMRQPFNINSLAISLAGNMLKKNSIVQSRITRIIRLRKEMEKFFSQNGVSFIPSQANFICAKIKGAKAFFEFCKRKNVFIRHLEAFGMNDYIRVTVSLKKHNLAFHKCLKAFLSKRG